jgi:hypothetical protein
MVRLLIALAVTIPFNALLLLAGAMGNQVQAQAASPVRVPLSVGDRVAIGLTTFRVLPNYALASERASRIVAFRK